MLSLFPSQTPDFHVVSDFLGLHCFLHNKNIDIMS